MADCLNGEMVEGWLFAFIHLYVCTVYTDLYIYVCVCVCSYK